MSYLRSSIFIAAVIFSVSLLVWHLALADPPLKPGNPGLPGCLAEVAELQSKAFVPQTGQTISSYPADDGDLERGVEWPVPRFTDNGDGTVTDNLTGLMWLKDASRDCFDWMAWQDALDMVADFNANPDDYSCRDYSASYNDWRLPNLKELLSLVDYSCHMQALPNTAGTGCWANGDPFIGVGQYWSGTTSADVNSYPLAAWTLHFVHGQAIPVDKTYSEGVSVWPVRGGN